MIPSHYQIIPYFLPALPYLPDPPHRHLLQLTPPLLPSTLCPSRQLTPSPCKLSPHITWSSFTLRGPEAAVRDGRLREEGRAVGGEKGTGLRTDWASCLPDPKAIIFSWCKFCVQFYRIIRDTTKNMYNYLILCCNVFFPSSPLSSKDQVSFDKTP